MYETRFTGAAEKYLKKIKEKGLKKAFQGALEEISSNPYIGELKTGDLAGIYCMMSTIAKSTMSLLIEFMKKIVKWWLLYLPEREKTSMMS